MSKRLGNAVNPFSTIEEFGSDPVRWYMIANSSPWDNLKFDTEGVREVARKLFATLYNTYSFLALYANVDGFTGAEPQVPVANRPEIDRWILSLLNTLVKDVEEALDDYEPTKAARAINTFVNDNLSNWYVRLNGRNDRGQARRISDTSHLSDHRGSADGSFCTVLCRQALSGPHSPSA